MHDGLAPYHLTLGDLDFDRAPAQVVTKGLSYTRWIPVGMPKLGPHRQILKSVVFLYDSAASAEQRQEYGGTGFLVSVGVAGFDVCFTYCVTNWHVAVRDGFSVIRLPCKDGSMESIELDPSEWHFRPGGPDIAVAPIRLDLNKHDVSLLGQRLFVDRNFISTQELDVGDDVFMIGRFIDYDGHETTEPALRFGNISIMSAQVEQSTKHKGESIILDMHSRTGFSGSPVYAYRTPASEISVNNNTIVGNSFLKLLGIHWGQFPERWQIENARKGRAEASLVTDGAYVTGLSGMTCICPAWDIWEALNMTKLKAERENVERELHDRAAKGRAVPTLPISETQVRPKGDAVLARMLSTPPKPKE